MQYWADHRKFYTFDTNDCQSGKQCGSYKRVSSIGFSFLILFLSFPQMVWANSTRIGCANAFCPNLPPKNFANKTLLVCYYTHSVDVNERPYIRGEPASQCPTYAPQKTGNFCVKSTSPVACHRYEGILTTVFRFFECLFAT